MNVVATMVLTDDTKRRWVRGIRLRRGGKKAVTWTRASWAALGDNTLKGEDLTVTAYPTYVHLQALSG